MFRQEPNDGLQREDEKVASVGSRDTPMVSDFSCHSAIQQLWENIIVCRFSSISSITASYQVSRTFIL